MAVPGTMGRVAFVDLDREEIRIEQPPDEVYLAYLGGYGLGAYFLYRLQKPKVDPLGPENHLGFFTGLLTGTPAITGNRYVVVGKSPKTLTWGDANSGGTFGPRMKAAGFDGVIFRGQAKRPVYLLLENGSARLLPADDWWGKDCVEIDEVVREQYGAEAGSACIGLAGERQQLLAAVINDKGRAAGRSGLGALMGSKRLKALVAVGDMTPSLADRDGLEKSLEEFRRFLRNQDLYKVLHEYGTAGITAGAVATQDCPIKNWAGRPDDFPTAKNISDDAVIAIQRRKYACWRCPIGCGGETEISDGPFKSRTHKPEYETLGSFGAMLLNDNLASINLCNEICNRYGLDTISTGCTIAFAMECFERGIITEADTDGLKLTWGNAEAIVELTRQIAEYRGFGKVLADGAKRAAERIGKGSEEYAMHIAGEEVPMHDPRLNPGIATSYKMDATPARHTQMSAWTIEAEFAPPGLWTEKIERYKYSGKGKAHAVVSNHFHAASAAGMCLFGWSVLPPTAICDCLTHVTGKTFTLEDVLTLGARIATLRIAFNLREGIRNVDLKVPGRILGNPPLPSGPVAGVTVDLDTQVREYLEAMGWDPLTGIPPRAALERVGLEWVIPDLHG